MDRTDPAPPAVNYTLFVCGVPAAHQRPANAGGRWVQRSDRPNDMNWRVTVRAAWLERFGPLGLPGPISLSLSFWGGRGDLSNLVKAVEDALGRTGWRDGLAPAYLDDRQVVHGEQSAYPAPTRAAGVLITLRPLAAWPLTSRSGPASSPAFGYSRSGGCCK